MNQFEKIINNKVVQNVLLWLFLLVIFANVIQSDNPTMTAIDMILFLIPVVYINNLLILPLLRMSKIKFAFFFLLNVFISTGLAAFFLIQATGKEYNLSMFLNFFGVMFLALSFASTIKVTRDGIRRRQNEKEAELQLLKGQLNPHFLFNTLNNFYGLSVIKSDKLPDLMLKLSDLLRYSLYETKEKFVPLNKEIQYLENYIALEKIRLEEETTIGLKVNNGIRNERIAPMLLIVFVENAFKHLEVNSKGSLVDINLEIENNKMNFTCKNSFSENHSKNNLEKGESGIGLVNAKKRLDLIYPNNYSLDVNTNDGFYTVHLTLQLS